MAGATCPENEPPTVDDLFELLAAEVRAVPFKHEDFWLVPVGVPESGDLR